MNLMTADTIPAGSAIWAESDEDVWVLAEVVRQENTLLTVRQKTTGEELEIDLVREEYELHRKRAIEIHLLISTRQHFRRVGLNENQHNIRASIGLHAVRYSRRAKVFLLHVLSGHTLCRG